MSRYGMLIQSVAHVAARIPAPKNLGETLARHATFARIMELSRTDTTVAWWTGSARFRGEEPPARLLTWRNLRRVRVDSERVPLAQMASDISPVNDFHHALTAWLHLSPLTDIATMTRDAPWFVWSPATIALIAVPAGRTLAYRALMRSTTDLVVTSLNRARTMLLPALSAQQPLIDEFSAEVSKAIEKTGTSKSA